MAKKLYETCGHRWIDMLDDVVYAYNITAHRATSKAPFLFCHWKVDCNSQFNNCEFNNSSNNLERISIIEHTNNWYV